MLYLEKACQGIIIACGVAIISAVIYVETTSPVVVVTQEMIEAEKRHEITNELADYNRNRQDCLEMNRSINNEESKSQAMTECLEERGHH